MNTKAADEMNAPETHDVKRGWRFIDRTGQRFGRLTVLRFAGMKKSISTWRVACDCGTTLTVTGSGMVVGDTRSCGCLRRETTRMSRRIHGRYRTPIYRVWSSMKERCTNPKQKDFRHYGGRGIKVCERWMQFDNFLADMGERPAGMTIDRIENDGPYSPDNCKWSTRAEQAINQRRTINIAFNGKTQPLKQWCRELGLNYSVTRERIKDRGISVVEAFHVMDDLH